MHTAGYIGSVVMLSKRFVVRDKAIGGDVVSGGRGRQQGRGGQGRGQRGGGRVVRAGGRSRGGQASLASVEADRLDEAPVIRITLRPVPRPCRCLQRAELTFAAPGGRGSVASQLLWVGGPGVRGSLAHHPWHHLLHEARGAGGPSWPIAAAILILSAREEHVGPVARVHVEMSLTRIIRGRSAPASALAATSKPWPCASTSTSLLAGCCARDPGLWKLFGKHERHGAGCSGCPAYWGRGRRVWQVSPSRPGGGWWVAGTRVTRRTGGGGCRGSLRHGGDHRLTREQPRVSGPGNTRPRHGLLGAGARSGSLPALVSADLNCHNLSPSALGAGASCLRQAPMETNVSRRHSQAQSSGLR